MHKLHINLLITGMTAMFLLAACSEDKQENKDTSSAAPVTNAAAPVKAPRLGARRTENTVKSDNSETLIMDQPLDFSSPENVDMTIQRIRDEQGEEAVEQLNSAVKYMMATNPEMGRSMSEVYENLDGKTPKEIIALANNAEFF